MSEPPGLSSPLSDLEAWRSQRAAGDTRLLTPDLAALAQNGADIALATHGPDGAPLVGLGYGCRVLPDGRMRLLIGRAANARLIAAIEAGGPLAATFTGAPDPRAFQVKAAAAVLCPACSDDVPEVDRQTALMRDGLIEVGFSPELAAGYAACDVDDLVALEFLPEKVFTQTPGPGAGAELQR